MNFYGIFSIFMLKKGQINKFNPFGLILAKY